jgi:hypothetical protein
MHIDLSVVAAVSDVQISGAYGSFATVIQLHDTPVFFQFSYSDIYVMPHYSRDVPIEEQLTSHVFNEHDKFLTAWKAYKSNEI